MNDKLIDEALLNRVSSEAKESARLRMNFNLHDSLNAKAQRLLNALEPGTVLPVHRHRETAETYIVLRGKLNVIFYNDNKEVRKIIALDPLQKRYGVHIPVGQWHTIEVLEPGTVIFEVKDGPYEPVKPEDVRKIE
jgi:cupin fold WbuC family metalloprotein